jgi:hypothetical protein
MPSSTSVAQQSGVEPLQSEGPRHAMSSAGGHESAQYETSVVRLAQHTCEPGQGFFGQPVMPPASVPPSPVLPPLDPPELPPELELLVAASASEPLPVLLELLQPNHASEVATRAAAATDSNVREDMAGLLRKAAHPRPRPPYLHVWLPRHVPDLQSPFAPQGLPVAQLGAHAGGWHLPVVQTSDAQSAFAPQPLPSLHVGAQPGAWHLPPVHVPDPQSPLPPHALPSAQVGAHAGGAHLPLLQDPELQSVPSTHVCPSPHPGAQVGVQATATFVTFAPAMVPEPPVTAHVCDGMLGGVATVTA